MFGWFGRKKTAPNADGTFKTFVEATNGGWGDAPKAVPVDGGNHRDYVARMLKEARQIGKKTVGSKPFTFTLHSIPRVEHPDLIVLPLMMEANGYGLQCVSSVDETVTFIRLE